MVRRSGTSVMTSQGNAINSARFWLKLSVVRRFRGVSKKDNNTKVVMKTTGKWEWSTCVKPKRLMRHGKISRGFTRLDFFFTRKNIWLRNHFKWWANWKSSALRHLANATLCCGWFFRGKHLLRCSKAAESVSQGWTTRKAYSESDRNIKSPPSQPRADQAI